MVWFNGLFWVGKSQENIGKYGNIMEIHEKSCKIWEKHRKTLANMEKCAINGGTIPLFSH
jgi:hypothetical protein